MTIQRAMYGRLQLLLILVFLSVAMRAQQQDLPVPVGTEMPAVAFQSEGKVVNVLRADFRLSTVFDDNAFGRQNARVNDLQFGVNPVFGFQQTRRHLQLDLTYAPGSVFSQRLPDRFTQMGGADIRYMPTPRLSFHVRQDYAVTTDPFQSVLQDGFLPQPAPTNRPNNPAIFPHLKQTTLMSNADVSYRLSQHTTVGLNGYFSDLRYDNLATGIGTPLIQTRTASGSFFLSHRLSARHSVGFEYTLLDLFFGQTDARTRAHNFAFFDNIALSRRSTLSVYAGPEYTYTHNQVVLNIQLFIISVPVTRTSWSSAGGAVYNWNGTKNAVQAGYSRSVSDGGGLIGAVRANSGFVQIRRQLPGRLVGDLGGQVSNNSALAILSGHQYYFRQVSGSIGLTRQISHRAFFRLSYSHLNQSSTIVPLANHDRVELSMSYQFSKPLGR
jgi:hypothetical protein